MSAREQCQGDLFATASSALRAAPPVADRVLLSDLIDAATLLSLGDDSGFGKNTLYRLRAEIAAASRELVRRWTEAQS